MSGDAKPRIGDLPREEWTPEAREVFAFWGEPDAYEQGSKTHMTMTMAQHPQLALAYNTFGKHILLTSTIAVRPRELIVLRCAWHLKCAYEWHYHVKYGIAAGLTMEEIAAIRDGPGSPVWHGKEEDRLVLTAVDELIRESVLSDATWNALSKIFDKRQIMDLLFTIGNYVMLGWAAGSMDVPVEGDVDLIGFDLKTRSGNPPAATFRPQEEEVS